MQLKFSDWTLKMKIYEIWFDFYVYVAIELWFLPYRMVAGND